MNNNTVKSSSSSTIATILADLNEKGGYAELYRYFIENRFKNHMRGRFPEVVVKYILAQMLSAIMYLHEQDPPIMHRDLKPENVVVLEEFPLLRKKDNQQDRTYIIPRVKVMDFGVARTEADLQTLKVGSPRYMAPEVYVSNTYDKSCDIYSLGITLYLLIVGALPQIQNPRHGIFDDPQAGPTIGRCISPEGFQLFVHMIAFRPNARYSARTCLENVWFDEIREEASHILNDPIYAEIGRLRDERNARGETDASLTTGSYPVGSPGNVITNIPFLPEDMRFHDVFEYDPNACIGAGATSKVYLCSLRENHPREWDIYWNHINPGVPMPNVLCVKIYDKDKLKIRNNDSIQPKVIQREFEFVARFPHRNLIRLYYLFTELAPEEERQTGNRATPWANVFVVQEYAPGIRESFYNSIDPPAIAVNTSSGTSGSSSSSSSSSSNVHTMEEN